MVENIRLTKAIFKSAEVAVDSVSLENDILPVGVDLRGIDKTLVSYFKEYGFKVSSIWKTLYGMYNGNYSDKYIPRSLYFYYIAPYLYNLNFLYAYMDKNMYDLHFPSVQKPITVIKNINKRFYNSAGIEITQEEAIHEMHTHFPFIIKPTIETGCGVGVDLIREGDIDTLYTICNQYKDNYIVQELVHQHPDMAVFNPTSLNTCRIYTYRPVDSIDYVILHAAIRFGGEGAFRDNASAGGGFCKINIETGEVEPRIYRYRYPDPKYYAPGGGLRVIPSWEKVKETVLRLHKTLPYMDWVGWDIAVNELGEPIMVELNIIPDLEIPQIMSGPAFGDYTDELMERISKYQDDYFPVLQRSFVDKPNTNAYRFDIVNEKRL